MDELETLLDAAVAFHGHLCAGQVLGVRLAMAGLAALGIDPEADRKRIIAIVEVDRCAADAVSVVARVSLGKRTLKYRDYGKMAATFVDLQTRRAVRTSILGSARERVAAYAPPDLDPKEAHLVAYQVMPLDELVAVREVTVALSEFDLPGFPRREVACEICGEKVMDGRDVLSDGRVSCRPCAGGDCYWEPVAGAVAADGGDGTPCRQ